MPGKLGLAGGIAQIDPAHNGAKHFMRAAKIKAMQRVLDRRGAVNQHRALGPGLGQNGGKIGG